MTSGHGILLRLGQLIGVLVKREGATKGFGYSIDERVLSGPTSSRYRDLYRVLVRRGYISLDEGTYVSKRCTGLLPSCFSDQGTSGSVILGGGGVYR